MKMRVRCPDDERWPNDIVGCGHIWWEDREDLGECDDFGVDCPNCGIMFSADEYEVPDPWAGYERGEYDRDAGRIICTLCDWYETGGGTACSWALHDHMEAEHPKEVNDEEG